MVLYVLTACDKPIWRWTLLFAAMLGSADCNRNPAKSVTPSLENAALVARDAVKPAIVGGTVLEAATGVPAAGAVVEWTSGNRRMGGTTNAKGSYAFSIPVPEGQDAKTGFAVAVAVWSNLSEAASREVTARSGETTQLNFTLTNKAASQIGSVRGRATDTRTGQGVRGVVVSIAGAGGELATVTQADGSYVFRQIGMGRVLVIRAVTKEQPCFVPVERSFNMTQAVATEDFPLVAFYTTALHCPTVASAPRRPGQ
jgi:hypothetical protein